MTLEAWAWVCGVELIDMSQNEPAQCTEDHKTRMMLCRCCSGIYMGHQWTLFCPWCEPTHDFENGVGR